MSITAAATGGTARPRRASTCPRARLSPKAPTPTTGRVAASPKAKALPFQAGPYAGTGASLLLRVAAPFALEAIVVHDRLGGLRDRRGNRCCLGWLGAWPRGGHRGDGRDCQEQRGDDRDGLFHLVPLGVGCRQAPFNTQGRCQAAIAKSGAAMSGLAAGRRGT